MNIKKYIIYGMACLASFQMSSCDDILDVDPVDSYTDSAVWGDLALAEAYLNSSYARMVSEPQKGSRWASLSEEVYQMHTYGTENVRQGYLSCDNSSFGWEVDMWNPWNNFYRAIKEVNIFFGQIEEVPAPNTGDDVWKDQLIGQAHFLRAYFYHQLYSLFGRVPIVEKVHPLDTEIFDEKRASIEEVTAFIVSECDKAAELLPVSYSDASDFGRATKGAALMLKGRTLLFAASPLYDDNYPTRSKWEAAAAANKAVIDLQAYSLSAVANPDEYAALFCDTQNPETIMQKLFDSKWVVGTNAVFLHQAPCGSGNGFESWGTLQPTHNIVAKFQNGDGTPYVQGAANVNPWGGRDLRLKASILLDGEMWGYGDDRRAIEFFIPGENGVTAGRDSKEGNDWWNGTKTGYQMRKFLDPNFDAYGTTSNTSPWIFMRLAEVYLNYAECQIELGNNAEALKYINLVRTRARMPEATGANIRAEYEYERQIELVFEGQRWFDTRRWKQTEEIYKSPIMGIDIKKFKDGSKTYNVIETPIETRNFYAPKNYWMPVPRSELRKAPQIDAAPYE